MHVGVAKSKQLLWFQLLGVIWHFESNTLECLLMNCMPMIPSLYSNGIYNTLYGKWLSIDWYKKKIESYLRSSSRYHCLPHRLRRLVWGCMAMSVFPSIHYTFRFPPTFNWLNLVTSWASFTNKNIDILKCELGLSITVLVLCWVHLLTHALKYMAV